MASPLPPDPYAALGVPKSADALAIKSAYRKLVLKCHPDKVADETLKARAADEFHKIHQAYEILVDDDRRERYNSQVRLAELRREAMERSGSGSGPRVEVRTAAYDIRTPGGATYTAQGPTRVFEERRPREYDDDRYEQSRASSRKYDGYEPSYGRRPAARADREPIRVATREKESDKTDRAERTRTRDREVRRERVRKTESASAYSDDSDGRANFENDYHRRSEDAARYQPDTRRGSDRRSSRDDYYGDIERKTVTAEDYIKRSRQSSYDDARPSPSRSTSSQNPYAYDVRPSRGSERPAYVRRSSAQPKPSSRRRSPERERRRDVIAEEEEYNPRPTLEKSNSDPARVKAAVPPLRTRIQRSQTYQPDEHAQPSPTGISDLRRAETMPMPATATGTTSPYTSRRRGVTQPAQPSKLRSARETMHDSGYSSSSPGAPDMAYPYAQEPARPGLDRSTSKTTYYTYPSGGGVSLKPTSPHIQPQESGYRTVTREPGQPRNLSPDPVSPRTRESERPPLATARTVPAPAPAGVPPGRYATATAAPSPTTAARSTSYPFAPEPLPRPPMGRNASYSKEYADADPPARSSSHRERGDMLYGEQYSDYHYNNSRRDRGREQPTSYASEEVNWAQPIGERDVKYAARRRDEPAGVRPGVVRRSETFAY
ncbi:hypothetical protein H2201_008308 [Coniosporium apollinis]|uniref:J domain-containing protein n=2 Tax=Coniosporium TaxID=2810619 RepID=A0ABQ9NGY3_9PEZI|nr:hypothetical protein H2199_007430 [Cladosporium sp. JES 115]KAJ9657100.1 hypothetical protein H2201_008308 [Coniosporium apollinis]